jgi:PadR family transcriptional regulator, regulatory protein PadR
VLESRWEDIDPSREGRPPWRYYRLKAAGVQLARDALASAYRPSQAHLRMRPVGER